VRGGIARLTCARRAPRTRPNLLEVDVTIRAGLPLPTVKVRDVVAVLEADGWHLVRTKGSHRQFRHPNKPGTVTVAGKASTDVPIGTLGSIWKQAGLNKP
jgi:predicted RNA binding protein YcfA (HicA-like mRNA interferase family)